MALDPRQFHCSTDPLDTLVVSVDAGSLTTQVSFGTYGENVQLDMDGLRDLADYLARAWYYLQATSREEYDDDE